MTYNEFIQNIIDTRGQWNIPEGEYWEGHHIIPKCFGGNGKAKSMHENIIWLYPQEHFIAHKLLALENPNNYSIITAFRVMCATTRRSSSFTDKAKINISPEDYALCRQLFNECPMPEEVRQKISNKHTGKAHPKPNTENYGKWRKGRHLYINQLSGEKLFLTETDMIPDGYILQTELTKAIKVKEAAGKTDARCREKTVKEKANLSKVMQNKHLKWFTNGIDEIRCPDADCPEGWYQGRSEKSKQKIKENHSHIKNAGEKNGMYNKHHTEETKQKIAAFGKNKHWFTNNKIEIFSPTCPDGFFPGRLKKVKELNTNA